jgi:hypothetical protein
MSHLVPLSEFNRIKGQSPIELVCQAMPTASGLAFVEFELEAERPCAVDVLCVGGASPTFASAP